MKTRILLADTHAHISKEYFQDPIKIINDLKGNAGLEFLSIMGVSFENNQENLEYKRIIDKTFLRIGVGLHPEVIISLGKLYTLELDRIINQIRLNKDSIDIIGEIGIDFYYPNSRSFESEQENAFRQLVKLGVELEKPLSIHARESFVEIMEIIDEEVNDDLFHGYLHCFTGNFEQGMFFIEKGFKLGLNGIITYNKSIALRQTVKELLEFYKDRDFNDLFSLETDTPYLAPEPIRSEQNTPSNIGIIAKYIEENILT